MTRGKFFFAQLDFFLLFEFFLTSYGFFSVDAFGIFSSVIFSYAAGMRGAPRILGILPLSSKE